jgi:hypothetical protein
VRGLVSQLLSGSAHAKEALTAAGSLLVLWFAILGRRKAGAGKEAGTATELAFGNAVIAGVLVGYHISPHDLSVLLLPLALILHSLMTTPRQLAWRTVSLFTMEVVLFLPPLHVWLLARHLYSYMAVPVLMLFAAGYAEIRKASSATAMSR